MLIIVILASLLGSTMVMANQCADYIGNYLIIQNYTDFAKIFDAAGNILPGVDAAAAYDFWIPRGTIVTTLTVAIGVGMVPAMAIFPLLRKKFSLKQIYIGSAAFGLVVHLLVTLHLQAAFRILIFYVLWIMLFLMGLPLGIYNVITYALIADAVDYLEWKTGERHEGVASLSKPFYQRLTPVLQPLFSGSFLTDLISKLLIKHLLMWPEDKFSFSRV